jgi:hypothetical protein
MRAGHLSGVISSVVACCRRPETEVNLFFRLMIYAIHLIGTTDGFAILSNDSFYRVMSKSNNAILMMLGKASTKSRSFILELFLIVAGILIALAIDEWREEIEESKTAQVFLQQLTADLVATEAQINAAATNTLLSEQAAKKIVDAFESGPFPEHEELSEWLARIGYVNNPVPVLGTAESLVSTGDLRVIPHIETSSGITSYLSRSKDFWLVPLYQLEDFHQDWPGVAPQAGQIYAI